MATKTATGSKLNNVRIKSVAMPAQHGGWGFWLEPALLGLLAAFTIAGLLLALAALGVFLLHQPLKITLTDRRKGKRYARTAMAERFVLAYGGLAAGGFLLATLLADAAFWQPIALAILLAVVQLGYELNRAGRRVIPELAGALAFGALAPAMALMAGWSLSAALILWGVLGVRVVTSILYVRARLRLEKGKPADVTGAIAVHVAGIAVLAALARWSSAPWLAVAAGLILLARAGWGLSRWRKPVPTKVIGLTEMGYGLLTVVLIAAGYGLF